MTVYKRGYHGDLNETFFVGTPKETAKKLVINTWECLKKAVDSVKPGVKFRDVGNVIQKHAQSEGFSVVRSYCGHGKRKRSSVKTSSRPKKKEPRDPKQQASTRSAFSLRIFKKSITYVCDLSICRDSQIVSLCPQRSTLRQE